MIDSVQLVLFFVVVVLTILLVVLGLQVYFILKDLRKTINKANRVLDQAGSITENVQAPLSSLMSLTSSFKAGSALTILKMVKGFLNKDDEEKKRKE